MKDKFKSYKFWMALLAGIIVLINALGTVFKFQINEIAITSIFTAVLGIFVILGFVNKDIEDEENNDEELNAKQDFEITNEEETNKETNEEVKDKNKDKEKTSTDEKNNN